MLLPGFPSSLGTSALSADVDGVSGVVQVRLSAYARSGTDVGCLPTRVLVLTQAICLRAYSGTPGTDVGICLRARYEIPSTDVDYLPMGTRWNTWY